MSQSLDLEEIKEDTKARVHPNFATRSTTKC